MLSHVRRELFLVITLPAMENKRSGPAEVAGIASTRLANTPNQDDDDCFYYHSWRNNVVIAFGTLSSFLT